MKALSLIPTDAGEGVRPDLICKIKVDPAFFVSLSDDDLLDIVSLAAHNFAEALGQGELEAQHYQDVCQREIDKRTEYKEAAALLRLYHKTQENSGEDGIWEFEEEQKIMTEYCLISPQKSKC